jgi:hypothetical protein
VDWTPKCPPSRRQAPENIMTKDKKILAEVALADTENKLWSLFF